MVAIPRQPESLVEAVFGWVGSRRRARQAAARAAGRPVREGPGWLARFLLLVGDVFGTVVSVGAVTVGAFLWLAPVGWVMAGVAVLVVDFKVSWSRKQRQVVDRGR